MMLEKEDLAKQTETGHAGQEDSGYIQGIARSYKDVGDDQGD